MTTLLARVEALVLRLLMGLPPWLVRRLAGRPVVVDGLVLDPETQWMLRLQRLTGDPGLAGTVTDVRRATARQTRLAGGRQPVGEVRDVELPGGDGPVPGRLYVPRSRVGDPLPSPLLFFIHGGGMVFGDLESHDATCRFLAERADTRVLAVDYRLAPEHPFPAAVEDCWAAFQSVAEDAARWGADPDRIAVGGDSAGGTLSAVVAVKAAEAGVPVRLQLLVYPATDMAETSESRRLFGDGFFLTSEFVELAHTSYVTADQDLRDPLVSVRHAEKLPPDLAPAHVVTAGFDPLRDEGEAYARMLAEAGVPVELTRYDGLIHGFLNVVGIGRSSRAAVAEIAARLKGALHG